MRTLTRYDEHGLVVIQGRPKGTVKRVLDVLYRLPHGDRLTTRALAARVGITYGTLQTLGNDPRFVQFKTVQSKRRQTIWSRPVEKNPSIT